MIASLGLTSCVDDEISPEVKAIYENQAAFLAAQTSLVQAEANLETAKAACQLLLNQVQEAQNTLAILNAQNALELAKEEHLKALLQLKLEVQAAKSQEAEKYLGKFLTETGKIIALESDLESQKRDLATLKASVIDGVFDKEEAKQKLNKAKSEVTRLEVLVDDVKLAAYVTLVEVIMKKE